MLQASTPFGSSCCLITGGAGNLACQLAWALGDRFERLVLTDVVPRPIAPIPANAHYESLDICDFARLDQLLKKHRPSAIIHLASLLSGSSERDPRVAWKINTTATLEILEHVRVCPGTRILFTSSVATYGGVLPSPLKEQQPQWPSTIYGVSKMACERMGSYYREAHDVDFRCVRLPTVISRYAPAGAVSAAASRAFIDSVQKGEFVFQAKPETKISGLYIKDVIKGLAGLLEAPRKQIRQPVYNLAGFTASFEEVSQAILGQLPQARHRFEIDPKVDDILSAWPREIDDSAARHDWNWQPEYDLMATTRDFIESIHAEVEQTS